MQSGKKKLHIFPQGGRDPGSGPGLKVENMGANVLKPISEEEFQESILIASILDNPGVCFHLVQPTIKGEHFTHSTARACWMSICKNYRDGEVDHAEVYRDMLTVADKAWFFDVTGNVIPVGKAVTGTASAICKAAKLRRLSEALSKMAAGAKASTADPDWVLEDMLALFRSETGTADKDCSIAKVIGRFDMVQERNKVCGSMGKRTGFELLQHDFITYQPGHLWVIGAWTSVGKAQPGTSIIRTPGLPIEFKNVKVGDIVCSSSGGRQTVTGVFPQGEKEIFEITFTDGRKARCCDDHLWKYRAKDKPWTVGPLKEIKNRGKAQRINIPIHGAIEYGKKDLPLDPYVFGILLGDGSFRSSSVRLTTSKKDIADKVESLLPVGDCLIHCREIEYSITTGSRNKTPSKTMQAIESCGLRGCYSTQKFIPECYLTSSVEDRRKLLDGLISTDGHVAKGSTCAIEYSTSSERLAINVVDLVRGLGGFASIAKRENPKYTHNGEERTGEANYRVVITLDGFSKERARKRSMRIISIVPVGREEAFCISVSGQDNLYITDDYVVTHNTAFMVEAVNRFLAENAGGRVAIFSTEMTEEQNVARILANTTGINANVILSGQMNDNHKERVDAHKLAVAAMRLNIYDKLRDVDDIMAQCRKLAHSGGIDIVWIDFIQNLSRPGSKSPYEMFSQIAKDLQALAHDLRCTVVCLSQLPNHAGREDTGILEFKGAGEIAAACDVGVLMKRAKEDKTQILFDVRKNRHGKCGKYLLQFDNGWTRIIEKEAVE